MVEALQTIGSKKWKKQKHKNSFAPNVIPERISPIQKGPPWDTMEKMIRLGSWNVCQDIQPNWEGFKE